jgi:hypothetical protein
MIGALPDDGDDGEKRTNKQMNFGQTEIKKTNKKVEHFERM